MATEEAQEKHMSEAEQNLASYARDGQPPIYRFVFTGGPCGGKTTALARVFSYLRERGFECITCPEAYTTLSSNGMSVDFFSTPGMPKIIQTTVLQVQMALEDNIYRVLQARGKPGVILCDRGTMDGSVYMDEQEFDDILTSMQTNRVEIRDNRYDGVFHLITAADGAEHFYTLENNQVRTETKEQAVSVDKKTQQAWIGHPHFYFIDNSTDFEGKMSRLVDTLSKIVGLPSNLKRRAVKFLLRQAPNLSDFTVPYQEFEVEKIYLQHSSTPEDTTHAADYSFIRRRTSVDPQTGQLLGSVYQSTLAQYTARDGGDNAEWIEQKRIISQREYGMASTTRDPHRHVVRQRRITFLYEKQSFTLHMFQEPLEGLCILHAQVEATAGTTVKLPPFVQVDRQLGPQDVRYGAYQLSLIKD